MAIFKKKSSPPEMFMHLDPAGKKRVKILTTLITGEYFNVLSRKLQMVSLGMRTEGNSFATAYV